MEKIHLSREEKLVLVPLMASMSQKAHHILTLPLLIEKWEKFVSDVEDGYNESIYEYTNDLSVRDLLQVVIEKSPLELRDKLIRAIQISDERFNKVTEESKHSFLLDKKMSQEWWWFRIPVNPGSELKKDLHVDGFI